MNKEYLSINCNKDCPYATVCCKVPTEVIRHEGREGIDLLIFGMGAGKDEERLRRCFVGRSGKYMRKIIKHLWKHPDCGPFNLAISNNVRFHPMDNNGKDREPTKEEIQRCISFLVEDIHTLDPKVIMPVGKNATKTFIDTGDAPMNSTRGKPYTVNINCTTRTIIPTYHPSFLTRNYGDFDPDKNNEYDKVFIADILLALGK